MTLQRLRIFVSLVAAAFLLCYAAKAEAWSIYPADGANLDLPYDNWHSGSLMPLPPGSAGVAQGVPCPAYPGQNLSCAYDAPINKIYFWTGVAEGHRLIYMHEVGHFIDFRSLTWGERLGYAMIRGSFDAERFAQDYALCAIPKYAGAATIVGAPCDFIHHISS